MSEFREPADPQGLPSIEKMAAMANELFQALPSAAPFFAGVSGLQAAAQAVTATGAQPQSGTKPQFDIKPPSGLATTASSSSSIASTPSYYFAENAQQYPLANAQVEHLVGRVSPHAFGLPAEEELRELLAENRFITSPANPPAKSAPKASTLTRM